MKFTILLALTFAILPQPVWSCIPSTGLILDRTADKHGRGAYALTQDLQFVSAEGSLRIREEWSIKDGNELRVDVTGLDEVTRGMKVSFIFKGQQRFKSSSLGPELINSPLIERFFHVRSDSQLLQMGKAIGAISSGTQLSKTPATNLESVQVKCNQEARLSRIAGVINYAFGAKSRSEEDRAPALWIEQDQFLIRRIQLGNAAEITASDYSDYSRNLYFPKKRIFKWGNSRGEAKIVSVRSINTNELDLNTKKLPAEQVWPSDARATTLLQGFYSRFR